VNLCNGVNVPSSAWPEDICRRVRKFLVHQHREQPSGNAQQLAENSLQFNGLALLQKSDFGNRVFLDLILRNTKMS
jgi:hypothetical protein